MKNSVFGLITVSILAISCGPKPQQASQYPQAKKVDSVDNYFGVSVADPYRWLENDTAAETAEWVQHENEVTHSYLDRIPYKNQVKQRIEKLVNFERISAPFHKGGYYYFFKNTGLQNHDVLYRKKDEKGAAEMFLDPNTFSKDGTTKLTGIFFSKDGSLAAYMISPGGQDWNEAIIIDANDGKVKEDTLRNLKFTDIAWQGNGGFYYSTYDKPKGSQLSTKTQHHKLMFHKLGTQQASDQLVFGGDKTPRRYIGAQLTEDEQLLVVSAATNTSGNELYVRDLRQPDSKLITIVGNFENNNALIDHDGTSLLIQTNLNAPNYRIVKTDLKTPSPENWKVLIPEAHEAIEEVTTGGRRMFVRYLKDAQTVVKQYDYKGIPERTVELPGVGTAEGFRGESDDATIYYTFTSFTSPRTVYAYSIKAGTSTVYAKPVIDFNADDYETKQIFYFSKDSTKVPMFITYKKGLEFNGKNPTWLYAYGGFNISMTPNFSASRLVWLENGGVYAQPCLRGGGEYGETWHLAGTKMNKQNVFDDFIAAGEYLIREKYTSHEYLAIAGGSNGGLLVGATMTQRPDLAKVAFPGVGVMDMLRYHKFTAGAGWAYDYGTSEDSKEMFEYLKKYSPLHALRPGTAYPATLVTTADHDDRVVPAHSFKFAATLQEYNIGGNPVLIRIDTKSGHSSSNLAKNIELQADQYSFAWYSMGIIPPVAKKDM